MMIYNKFFIVITLILSCVTLFAQEENDIDIDTFFRDKDDQELFENQSLPQSVRIPPIQELSILDSTLISIIDSVLQQEKKCSYFSTDLCLGILFARNNDDSIRINSYRIQIELSEKKTLLSLNPIGYFIHQDFYAFVYDIVALPKELFSYTKLKKDFNHYINYDDYVIDDDRYSMYFYWYVNNQFFFEKAYKCKK